MTSEKYHGVDGQHGGLLLDLKSGKSWRVFVANRVRKIAQITEEVKTQWKYCLTERKRADLESKGASLSKMEENGWYEGPQWLLVREDWPPQPSIKCTPRSQEEENPLKDIVAYTREETPTKTKEQAKGSTEDQETDEWEELLSRSTHWRTLRTTAWVLRFKTNSLVKLKKIKKSRDRSLYAEELAKAKQHWVERAQRGIPDDMERPGCKLVKDKKTNLRKRTGRIQEYNPVALEDEPFV